MMTRNEIIEMLMAASRKSRLCVMLINDEHHRQIALAKAMFDAEIDASKREMAFINSNLNGALNRLFLSLQGWLSESSEVIDHAGFATKLAQAKEAFGREIAALRQELVQAYQEPATLRAVDAFGRSGRGPNDVLN